VRRRFPKTSRNKRRDPPGRCATHPGQATLAAMNTAPKPKQRVTLDPAIDRSVINATLIAPSGARRDFQGWPETSKTHNRPARRRRERDPDHDIGRRLEAIAAGRSMILGDALAEDRDNALNEDEGVLDEQTQNVDRHPAHGRPHQSAGLPSIASGRPLSPHAGNAPTPKAGPLLFTGWHPPPGTHTTKGSTHVSDQRTEIAGSRSRGHSSVRGVNSVDRLDSGRWHPTASLPGFGGRTPQRLAERLSQPDCLLGLYSLHSAPIVLAQMPAPVLTQHVGLIAAAYVRGHAGSPR
jgi:hypothetical protein